MPPSRRDAARKPGPTELIHDRRIKRRVATTVEAVVRHKRGTALKLYRELLQGVNRIAAHKLRAGETQTDVRINTAIYIDEMVSRLADHVVKPSSIASREKSLQQATLEDLAKAYGLEKGPNLENELWEKIYAATIERLKARGNPAMLDGLEQLNQIKRYEELPDLVYKLRKEHGRKINQLVEQIVKTELDPERNLVNEVQRILQRPYKQEAGAADAVNRLRALDIILAASIYADVIERTKILPDIPKTQVWQHAYKHGMRVLFPIIQPHHAILNKIAEFE